LYRLFLRAVNKDRRIHHADGSDGTYFTIECQDWLGPWPNTTQLGKNLLICIEAGRFG